MRRETVKTGSPYEPLIGISRAVKIGQFVAISGTAPLDSDGKTVAPGDPENQARRCFQIAEKALIDLGAKLSDVIRTRIFLTDIKDWKVVGKVHGEIFSDIRPASTVVQVSRFVDPEWRVEIELDAVIDANQ